MEQKIYKYVKFDNLSSDPLSTYVTVMQTNIAINDKQLRSDYYQGINGELLTSSQESNLYRVDSLKNGIKLDFLNVVDIKRIIISLDWNVDSLEISIKNEVICKISGSKRIMNRFIPIIMIHLEEKVIEICEKKAFKSSIYYEIEKDWKMTYL